MTKHKIFNTRGPVDSEHHYSVPRTAELADLVNRIKEGRYSVIFAPRQTGKTTLFRRALDTVAEDDAYFPIQLDFQTFRNASIEIFYKGLKSKISKQVKYEFQCRNMTIGQDFQLFLDEYPLIDHHSLTPFLEELAAHLDYRRVAIIIVGIVGVKSINQLNYDRSISPFNIQDDFALDNFTQNQVGHLLAQYTEAVGQAFEPDVIEGIYRQTSGQPFLVNRLAQILTEELDIPLSEKITASHFEIAHHKILDERNTNIIHLTTNIRRDRRFEALLMQIALQERPVRFNLDNEFISELATYGILVADERQICKIQNPIYQYRIMQTFQPLLSNPGDT